VCAEQIRVREAVPEDASLWEAMRRELWPDGAEDHAPEIAMFFAGTLKEPVAVLMAENAAGMVVGFAELSIRDDVAAVEGKRTGYVEGLWVRPEDRGGGVARTLMRASREWALQQTCAAFGSDRAGRVAIDKSFQRWQGRISSGAKALWNGGLHDGRLKASSNR